MLAGRSAVFYCSDTAPDTSSTTRTQTEPPFDAAAMNSVSTPPVAMAKLAPMSFSAGAVVHDQSPAGVGPRWKPMPMSAANFGCWFRDCWASGKC